MRDALARRSQPAAGLLRVEQARQLLAACKDVDEAKDIRDQAAAVQAYLRQQRASREAQNDAGEIKLRAERRLGQLLAEQQLRGGRQRRGDAGRAAARAPKAQPEPLAAPAPPPPTLEQLGVDRNHAARWRQAAQVPAEKFETFIRTQREHPAGEVTTAGLIRVAKSRNPHAASRVNDGDPEKNDRFTKRELIQQLHQRFRFTVDAFGHGSAPAGKVIGRFYTVKDDAFEQDFTEERVFSNAPWDEHLAEAVRLAHEQVEKGCELWVHLMPANRTEQPFWHRYIEPYRPDRGGAGVRVEFIETRESYGNPDDPEGLDSRQPNMPSCLVIWEGSRRRSPAVPSGPNEQVEAAAHPAEPPSRHRSKKLIKALRGDAPLTFTAPTRNQPPPSALISVDRFKGEAIDLGFSAKLVWAGTPREEQLLLKCGQKGCQDDHRVPLSPERQVSRDELKALRRHQREAHQEDRGRKKRRSATGAELPEAGGRSSKRRRAG